MKNKNRHPPYKTDWRYHTKDSRARRETGRLDSIPTRLCCRYRVPVAIGRTEHAAFALKTPIKDTESTARSLRRRIGLGRLCDRFGSRQKVGGAPLHGGFRAGVLFLRYFVLTSDVRRSPRASQSAVRSESLVRCERLTRIVLSASASESPKAERAGVECRPWEEQADPLETKIPRPERA